MSHSPCATEASDVSSDDRRKRIPGEAGTWVFIFGDMTVFAVLFVYYLIQRSKQPELFDASQATLNKDIGAVNTVLLLVSSLLVVLALRASRNSRGRVALHTLFGAMLCGFGFIAIKFVEYYEKLSVGQTPATNDFYMLYFVLTGLHLFHLIVGLVVLTIARSLVGRPRLTDDQESIVEGCTCFWHMVDLLWLVLFPLIFLVR